MSVDPSIRAQVMEILSDPMSLPPEFWGYDVQNWMKEAPVFPISQVFGFTQFTAQQASSSTVDAGVTATAYAAFTSGGPSLTGISPGKYLVIAACDINATGGAAPRMGYSVNGVAPDSQASCAVQVSGGYISVTKPSLVTLTLSSNTLEAQRRIDVAVGSADFGFRSLTVLKYSNL